MSKKKKDEEIDYTITPEVEFEPSPQKQEPQLIMSDGVLNDANITIRKASITKDNQLKVDYTAHHRDGNSREVGLTADAIVHQDMNNAFYELIPHLVILCDQKNAGEAKEILDGKYGEIQNAIADELQHYSVTGFSVSKGNDGITLIGRKTLEDGKVLNLTSPYEPFSESGYYHMPKLMESIKRCKDEVVLYLNGKSGFKQTKMFDDEMLTSKQEAE